MNVVALHDKQAILPVLMRSPLLRVYEIGDLDDFFWRHTVWYGLEDEDGARLEAVAVLYTGAPPPVLLALDEPPADATRELIGRIRHLLPARFDAHASPGVLDALGGEWSVRSRGTHLKMALTEPSRLAAHDTCEVSQLGPADLADLQALYRESYPGNWFDPRMLETGQFFGIRCGAGLVSVAGIHVYSPRYRVAAIGNITTHPELRRQGLSTRTTAALCRSLLAHVDTIGLNVDADNTAAIACYRHLGFTQVGAYHEVELTLR